MKTTIYDVTFLAREVDIPAACPTCNAPLLDANIAGLVRYNILDAEAFFVILDGDDFEVTDNGEQLDDVDSYPTMFACRECSEVLVASDVIVRKCAVDRGASPSPSAVDAGARMPSGAVMQGQAPQDASTDPPPSEAPAAASWPGRSEPTIEFQDLPRVRLPACPHGLSRLDCEDCGSEERQRKARERAEREPDTMMDREGEK